MGSTIGNKLKEVFRKRPFRLPSRTSKVGVSSLGKSLEDNLLAGTTAEQFIDIEDKEGLNKVFGERYPKDFIKHVLKILKMQMEHSQEHFKNASTSYFAHFILMGGVQHPNGVHLTPQDFKSYPTIQDLFPLVALIERGETSLPIDSLNNADTLTVEGLLMWFVETYIEEQLLTVLTDDSQGRSLLNSRLSQEENLSEATQQEALLYIVSKIDKVVFLQYRSTLMNTLRNRPTEAVYKEGEMNARIMLNSHNKKVEDMDKEGEEFLKTVTATNFLWETILTQYEKKYKRRLPRGKVSLETYTEELKPILNMLQKQAVEVPVEHIRDLAHLTTTFDKEVVYELLRFEYA